MCRVWDFNSAARRRRREPVDDRLRAGAPVLFLRDSIDSYRRILAHAAIASLQGRHIDEMCQGVEPALGLTPGSFHYLEKSR
jgi:hypothetical protein